MNNSKIMVSGHLIKKLTPKIKIPQIHINQGDQPKIWERVNFGVCQPE